MAIITTGTNVDVDTTVNITTSGENRALLLMVAGANLTKPTSITFNSASFVQAVAYNGATDYASIWLLMNPDEGTYNITMNQNGGYVALGVALSGVNTGAGVIAYDTTDGSGANNSVSASGVLSGDYLFACAGLRFDVGNITVTSGSLIYTNNNKFGSGYDISTDTSVDVLFNFGGTVDSSGVGIVLRPAEGQAITMTSELVPMWFF